MISMMMIIIINPNCSKYFLFHILIIYSLFNLGSSLRLVMLEVPSPSYAGESIELSCIYDLEQDKLYSVKWYKNDVEFYRYVPKDWPPGQFLPINGIRVDLGKSGMNSVFLKFIDINTAGVYRCEVSAEAPSFVTAEGEKELHVTVLPLSGPRIIGVQPSYKIGDEVNLTCISARSKPYSTLKWYINNKEIKSVINASHVVHDDNLETSGLQLQFIALEKHFKSGAIHIKCTSTVIRIHTMSNEVLLRLESPMTSDKYLDSYFSETLNQPMDGVMSITGAQLHQSILIALISMVIGRHLSLVSSIVD
uniref:Ig-like domain-containing protein n=1 Tax=Sarcoptes scabiei TaxID=52283 RepID=A0A834R6T9_SARSC